MKSAGWGTVEGDVGGVKGTWSSGRLVASDARKLWPFAWGCRDRVSLPVRGLQGDAA